MSTVPQFTFKRLYELAHDYQREGTGKRWEELFDYMHNLGLRNVDVTADEFVEKFEAYLRSFGMFRAGRFRPEHLPAVLKTCKAEFAVYLSDPTDRALTAAWIKCWDAIDGLKSSWKITPTPTLITKILMGLGGHHPALDSRVVGVVCNQPLFMMRGTDDLVAELKRQGSPLTTAGGNEIPWERVLDMALWQAGPDYAGWIIED